MAMGWLWGGFEGYYGVVSGVIKGWLQDDYGVVMGRLWGGYTVVNGKLQVVTSYFGVVMVMAYYGLYHLWLINIIYSLYRLWLISPMNIFIFRLSWSLRSN